MDVSVETNPTVTPSVGGQCFPPPSPTPSRKRAFSEVDEPNAQRQETPKYQKHDGPGDQENRNPLQHPDHMVVDKSTTSTTSVTSNFAENTSATTSTTPLPAPPSTPRQPSTTTTVIVPSAATKKQKLSPNSKEAKRLEKEEKDRLRLEEKAKKEEEKRIKEEERKKKEAEREEEKKKRDAEREEERKRREEKKKAKEEERHARDEEKRKKEEEKVKKERSQMKLSSFFAKPAADANKPPSVGGSSPRKDSTRDLDGSIAATTDVEDARSDYRNEFPDFFIQSHTQLAPSHRFQRDEKATEHIREKLDGFLKETDAHPLYRPSDLFEMMPFRRRNGRNIRPVRKLMQELQDDTDESTRSEPGPQDFLRKITMKSLKFAEDVRPAYYGTFTRSLSRAQVGKLCRRPYSRGLPDINYDYDSEAEWEEPEEGEDLDSEGEEEMSEDGDDDMDGFLDDEDEQIDGRRRLVVGDLEPVCTGIKWQDEGDKDPILEAYRIETISDTVQFPIDPFSTAYWPKPKVVEQAASKGHASNSTRGTLHAFSTNPITQSQMPLAPTARPGMGIESAGPSKKGKPFPPDQLAAFKEAVEGSDLTKAGLIEVLKKRFPKISKDTLKDTLTMVAVRVGQKEADKKWVCN
ncbi:Chromatin assembly factor 1 subunit rlf2 [Talaromyces islandicus]|uniref:Chromatin assembly factor 1 subunit rlf2 n=1 Tax=Talaromyces islandicus TaxID=28573 RepID=A0A0U1LW63_TALIS|nr:Chromatin assembly factor 1 subunit rlf2 [Talaromyces islandicus]